MDGDLRGGKEKKNFAKEEERKGRNAPLDYAKSLS